MLKGHVRIDLHNHKTGLKDRYEQENLITKAVDYITPFYISGGATLTNMLLPLYKRALGGIMLFDDLLTESRDNIWLPSDAHLVGFAGQTQTFDDLQGSLNTSESSVGSTGATTVWDFATNQAKGLIKSVALTGVNSNGSYACTPFARNANMFHRIYDDGAMFRAIPITFKDNYFYYISIPSDDSTATTSHTVEVRKQYVAINKLKVADAIESYGARSEVIDTITITTSRSVNNLITRACVDTATGYVYFCYNLVNGEGNNGSFAYQRMSIDDIVNTGTVAVSSEVVVTVPNMEISVSLCDRMRIINGVAYIYGVNKQKMYIVDLSNTANVIEVALTGDYLYASGAGDDFIPLSPNGAVIINLVETQSENPKNKYYHAYLYPDGHILKEPEPYSTDDNQQPQTQYATSGVDAMVTTPQLIQPVYNVWGWGNAGMTFTTPLNYLGSICNLQQAVTKTSSTSMKVTYTLTDITE